MEREKKVTDVTSKAVIKDVKLGARFVCYVKTSDSQIHYIDKTLGCDNCKIE